MQVEQTENRTVLRGFADQDPVLSHRVHGVDFFTFPLRVPRLSGAEDVLNLLVVGSQLAEHPVSAGDYLEATGEIRSFNNRSGVGSRLVITLLVQSLVPGEGEPKNEVRLAGIVCKPPVFRRTPLGRDICDLLLAVNRRYRRADYLPCIAWGSLAAAAADLQVGSPLALSGRLQSRTYVKRTAEGSQERTAYEISIMSLAPPEDPEQPEELA